MWEGDTHAPEKRIRVQKLHVGVGLRVGGKQPTLRFCLRRKDKSEEATADTLTMAYRALRSTIPRGRGTHSTTALWKPGDWPCRLANAGWHFCVIPKTYPLKEEGYIGGMGLGCQLLHHSGLTMKELQSENMANYKLNMANWTHTHTHSSTSSQTQELQRKKWKR